MERQRKLKQLQEERQVQDNLKPSANASPSASGRSPSVSPAPVAQSESRSPNLQRKKSLQKAPPAPLPAAPPPVRTSPSKAVLEIQNIQKAREERRAMQAEVKKMKEGLTTKEQDHLAFRQLIDRFRESNAAALKRIKSEPQPQDFPIRVCVRKRPMNARGWRV
jgi:hypothetical protein